MGENPQILSVAVPNRRVSQRRDYVSPAIESPWPGVAALVVGRLRSDGTRECITGVCPECFSGEERIIWLKMSVRAFCFISQGPWTP